MAKVLPTVWITKYALSTGVFVSNNATLCSETSEKMIRLEDRQLCHKPHWHESEKEANERVLEMVNSAIKSTEKKLKKLKDMKTKMERRP